MTTPLDRDLAERLERLAAAVPVRAGQLDPVHAGAVAARQQVRMRWLTPLVGLVVLVLVASVVGIGPLNVLNGPISSTTRQGDFELTMRSAKATYMRGEPIVMSATLTYVGPDRSVRISHAGSPMTFGIVEPVHGLLLNGMWADSCGATELQRGVGLDRPFTKSFGTDHELEPEALAFISEPRLVLPPGTWHPYVVAEFALGDCGSPKNSIRTQVAIDVLDGPTWVDPARPTALPSPSAIPESSAVHIVNLDPKPVEVEFRNKPVAWLSCGESAVISVIQLDSSPPWTFIVRNDDGTVLDAATLDWQLPAGILIRDGAVLSGAWPMSYGSAFDACSPDTLPSPTATSAAATNRGTVSLPTPGPMLAGGPMVEAIASDELFELEIATQQSTFRPDQAIDVHVQVGYLGPESRIQLWSADPAVIYTVEQLDGLHRIWGGARDSCSPIDMFHDAVQDYAFTKSAGYSPDDTDVDWIEAYLSDPDLHLPVGTWRLTAIFDGSVGACDGPRHHLSASIVILVE